MISVVIIYSAICCGGTADASDPPSITCSTLMDELQPLKSSALIELEEHLSKQAEREASRVKCPRRIVPARTVEAGTTFGHRPDRSAPRWRPGWKRGLHWSIT